VAPAFLACSFPLRLSRSGQPDDPGTFLRVPPDWVRDSTPRSAAHPFDAYSSSIRRRFCGVRTGPAPPSDDTPSGTRLPHWPWSQPERYCDSAGYRVDSVAQAAPAEVVATSPTVLLCLLRRLADGSRPLTPEGSLPAFAWSDVATGSTPVRPITGRRSLPPSSFTRSPIDSPCGSSPLAGGLRAYHVASRKHAWVRSRLDAGGSSSAPGDSEAPGPGHVPFGPSLSAPLACSWSRR
jgi:hypothetical protein